MFHSQMWDCHKIHFLQSTMNVEHDTLHYMPSLKQSIIVLKNSLRNYLLQDMFWNLCVISEELENTKVLY